jgi:hypothetical protein
MKLFTAIVLTSALALGTATVAEAKDGCGRGFHRDRWGHCRPNHGRNVYVTGRYYPGHGYWYHNRWYQRRHRRHGVWIYL